MSDELPPDPPVKDGKGRFLPGHKFARGRPKGSENKFGPGFRDRLLAGIMRSGAKKARKAGVNHKVDGLEYFVESLVDTNAGAAATLIAKLIPPEQAQPEMSGVTPGVVVNVRSAAEGQSFAPGNTVLMPFDEAGKAWQAYRTGVDAWKAYLVEVEPQLTQVAFANLCSVPPPEPNNIVNLHDRKLIEHEPPQIEIRTPEDAELLAELSNLTDAQLRDRAARLLAKLSDLKIEDEPDPAA